MKIKSLVISGRIVVGIFSVAGAITAASAFLMLHFFESKMITNTLVSILFIATIIINYRMCKYAVPEMFINMFGSARPLQGLMKTSDGHHLSVKQRVFMLLAILLAFSVGITFGALNYYGTLVVIETFQLPPFISTISSEIAFVFALVMCICLGALMLKSLVKVVQTENIFLKFKTVFDYLIDTSPDLPRNQGKSNKRIAAERMTTVILAMIALPLAMIGLFMMIQACNIKLCSLLCSFPSITPKLAHNIASSISFGLALAGQTPFVIRTSILTISSCFDKTENMQIEENKSSKKISKLKYAKSGLFLIMRFIYAIGNGFISMLGAQEPLTMMLAGAGSSGYSFAASAHDPSKPASQ